MIASTIITIPAMPENKRNIKSIDFFLLFFLLSLMIDKVVIKPIIIIVALIWMGKSIDWKTWFRSPLFYIFIPCLELVRILFFQQNFSNGHIVSFLIGESYWIMSFLCFMIIRTIVKTNQINVTEATLWAYFFINAIVSFVQLAMVMIHSGSLNPYALADPKYGSSTGDYIQGVLFAPCHLNMLVNAMFAIYFLFKNDYWLYFLATLIAILTSTNFANIIFVAVVFVLLFFIKNKTSRKIICIQLICYVVFYLLISKGNYNYAFSSIKEQKQTPHIQENAVKNGKMLSFEETYNYITSSKNHFLFGAGMGNFSSLLALRTSGLQGREHSRFFEHMPVYIANDYFQNHYKIFEQVFNLPEEYHSAKNFPHSFLNQIFGEYGLLGFAIFLTFYVGFFLRQWRQLSYTIPLGFLLAGFFVFDYLFEYLSVVVMFELFFLTDIKRNEFKLA